MTSLTLRGGVHFVREKVHDMRQWRYRVRQNWSARHLTGTLKDKFPIQFMVCMCMIPSYFSPWAKHVPYSVKLRG